MKDVPVIDQQSRPACDSATTGARLSFLIEWTAEGEPVTYDDPERQFRFTGWLATARLEARVELPAIGFSWQSDRQESSHSDFAIIGTEVKGKYYAS